MNSPDPNRTADRQKISPYNDPRKIFKYELDKNDHKQLVSMPFDSEILCVSNQHESLCIWALVNPCNKHVNRQFTLYATGVYIKNSRLLREDYLGTVQFQDGNDVVHVFDMGITGRTAEELYAEVSAGRE